MSLVISAVRAMAHNLTSIDVFRMFRETAKELSADLEQVLGAGVVPDPVVATRVSSKQVVLLALLGELEERGVLRDIEAYLNELYVPIRPQGSVQ